MMIELENALQMKKGEGNISLSKLTLNFCQVME